MRQRFTALVLSVLLLIGLSGCTFILSLLGNGEGYTGYTGAEDQSGVPYNQDSDGLDSSIQYVWFKPNHTCVDSEGETQVSYYKQIILVKGKRFELYGDVCSSEVIYEGPVEELDQMGDLIGFREGIFQRW